jgi:hypothetical protein
MTTPFVEDWWSEFYDESLELANLSLDAQAEALEITLTNYKEVPDEVPESK